MPSEKTSKNEKALTLKQLVRLMFRTIGFVYSKIPLFVALTLIMNIVNALLPFLTNWINAKVLDGLIAQIGSQNIQTAGLVSLILIYLGVLLVQELVSTFQNFVSFNSDQKFRRAMREDMTRKFGSLDAEYYETPLYSNLIQRARQQYTRVLQFFDRSLLVIDNLVVGIGSFVIMLNLGVGTVAILLIGAVPEAILNALVGKKSWKLFADNSESIRDYEKTHDYLSKEEQLKEIRIFGLKKYLLVKGFKSHDTYWKGLLNLFKKRDIIGGFLGVARTITFGIVFYFIILKVVSGEISVGLFTFYLATTKQLSRAVGRFLSNLASMYEIGLYVSDVFEFMDLPPKIIYGHVKLADTGTPPRIEFKNVAFRYPGTDIDVIKNFNLIINPGEHVAFVGENGAGKTTLIKLLMRFYDVTEGEILINNIPIKELDLETWYAKVGALFQDYNFYHFDAKTNIGVGNVLDIENLERITQAAQKSGAHGFIEKYENKYDQILDKAFTGGINPSEGQKQRIALARAFFKEAPVLIMDEPTSAIDPKAEYEIFHELLNFAKDKTVIIISHRFSTVRNAGRILVIDDGGIVEEGSHDHLMAIENGKYKHAFELQRRGYQ